MVVAHVTCYNDDDDNNDDRKLVWQSLPCARAWKKASHLLSLIKMIIMMMVLISIDDDDNDDLNHVDDDADNAGQ